MVRRKKAFEIEPKGRIRSMSKKKTIIITVIIIILLIVGLVLGLYFGIRAHKVGDINNELLRYLSQIYPAGKDSLSKLSQKDLLKFYNNLGWYYQCCYTCPCSVDKNGNQNIAVKVPLDPYGAKASITNWPSQSWSAIGCCEDYSLPILPSGYLYDWPSYQYFNVPVIGSDSTNIWFAGVSDQRKININDARGNMSTFGSQSILTIPFTGIAPPPPYTKKGTRVGPGPFFAGYRAIMRAIYYPFGPIFDPKKNIWLLNGEQNIGNNWFKIISDEELESKLNLTQTKKSWYFGYEENEYIEICHVEYYPGLGNSTGYWLNHFPGGGTGIFYKIGKTPKFPGTTKAPRNKVSLLFTLLSEVASYTRKNNKKLPCYLKYGLEAGCYAMGTNTFQYGDELLQYMYGTSDPYEIVFMYCGSNTPFKKEELAVGFDYKPFVFLKLWVSPSMPSQKQIYGNVSWDFVSSITHLGIIDTWKERNPNDPTQNSPYLDTLLYLFNSTLFENFAGWLMLAELGWNAMKQYGFYNKNTTWTLNREGKVYAINKVMYSNWFYDRTSNGVPFDEVNFYMGTILNYETLQMPLDGNTAISWGFEIIDLRLPEDGLQNLYKKANKKFPDNALNWRKEIVTKRRYPYLYFDTKEKLTVYLPYSSMLLEQNMTQVSLSLRDPLNVNDNSVVKPCNIAGGFKCDGSPNVKCSTSSPLDKNNQPSDNRYYYGTCTTTNANSILSGTNNTERNPYPIVHSTLNNNNNNLSQSDLYPLNPIEKTFIINERKPKDDGKFVSSGDGNTGSIDVIVDKVNNFCMPLFANTIDENNTANWDGMGSVYCQSDSFPTNVFWGNIPYGTTNTTDGKTSVILPNINLF